VRALRLRPRLLISAAAGLAAWPLLPGTWPFTARLLLAWDTAALLYLVLAWTMMGRSSEADLHRRASDEDEGAVAVLVLTTVTTVVSLGAIAAELAGIHTATAGNQALRVGLTLTTILCSWFFLHTMFALHYAHQDYDDEKCIWALRFPDDARPDYWDFVYFSFTIGAAAQTSDVSIAARPVRRVVLAHTILSFLFNTTVLALAVNVGAGLL
jgi:uncharacterized membrane protein